MYVAVGKVAEQGHQLIQMYKTDQVSQRILPFSINMDPIKFFYYYVVGANDGGGGSEFLLVRYGDECFYNKISLLHFIIFFLLGGLTVLIVGGVQFKDEAGLSNLKYHFLIAGGVLIILGIVLLVVKCACFRKPIPNEDEEMMEDFGHTKTVGEKEQPVKDLKSPNNSDSTPPQPPHLSVTITPASLTSVTSSRSRTPSMKETGLGTLEENQALTQDSPTSKTPTRDRRPSGQSSKGLKNQSDTSTLIKDSRPLKCQEGHQ